MALPPAATNPSDVHRSEATAACTTERRVIAHVVKTAAVISRGPRLLVELTALPTHAEAPSCEVGAVGWGAVAMMASPSA